MGKPRIFFVARDKKPATEEHEYDDEVWMYEKKPKRETAYFGKQVQYIPDRSGRVFKFYEGMAGVMGLELKPGDCTRIYLQEMKQGGGI